METIITIRKKSGALKYLIGMAKELEKKNSAISVVLKKENTAIVINGILVIPPKTDTPADISIYGKYPDFPSVEEIRSASWRQI